MNAFLHSPRQGHYPARAFALCLIAFFLTVTASDAQQNPPPNANREVLVGENSYVVYLAKNDTDQDGFLSREEASKIRLMRPAMFDAMDRDGDDRISRSEAERADRIDQNLGEPATLRFEGKDWITTHAIGAERVTYKGKEALHLVGREQCLVYLPIDNFTNGTIEADMAGEIFTGIGFRVREDGKRSEKLYFRPQNSGTARHENSVQYGVIGREDGHWRYLRQNQPGKYESGADLEKGEWFHVRLEIEEDRLEVFVNHGEKPVLTVDPLLDGVSTGSVGLWGWDSYFANFKVTRR